MISLVIDGMPVKNLRDEAHERNVEVGGVYGISRRHRLSLIVRHRPVTETAK